MPLWAGLAASTIQLFGLPLHQHCNLCPTSTRTSTKLATLTFPSAATCSPLTACPPRVNLALLTVDIRNERDVQFVCNWILACCGLHNIVNRLRNGEDDVPLYCEAPRASQVSNAIPQDNCLII
ncbi:hypothetical protein H257_01070 [Aphanomyces astaci]|uniref:DDE Tnp4 domain-containing protein n=1 Tax=Aphanomyces astaci TaxID=112090 RepID=W4H8C3_APHAT|nr:hypothetical protein H257_01070 [Aphanomyces astaci]ETV87529.1 hypothetical protein H257_01070 [Aphanomyces astaci]|eukprot:XP_009822392.1 hypothetical protein H257_01070 [Aphanomyces astaci]